MNLWLANSDGFSFVISFASTTGPGFHGRPGYVASWRANSDSSGAIKVSGSPFKTYDDAEKACNRVLEHLCVE